MTVHIDPPPARAPQHGERPDVEVTLAEAIEVLAAVWARLDTDGPLLAGSVLTGRVRRVLGQGQGGES